jgi:hypothetical protein
MGPAAKTPHTLVHTDLAKFGAHAHLDKDRAVTEPVAAKLWTCVAALSTFCLQTARGCACRCVDQWLTHIAGPGCGSLPRRNPDPPSSGLQGVAPCRRLPCRSASCVVSRSPYPPPGKCWPPLAKPPEKGTVRQPCIAQLDGYLRHRNAQTVGRDLTERRIGARAHVLRAATGPVTTHRIPSERAACWLGGSPGYSVLAIPATDPLPSADLSGTIS